MAEWLNLLGEKPFAVIEIGAGTAVATVRWQSVSVANSNDATLVRINPRDWDIPNGQISIPMTGAEGIQHIYDRLAG